MYKWLLILLEILGFKRSNLCESCLAAISYGQNLKYNITHPRAMADASWQARSRLWDPKSYNEEEGLLSRLVGYFVTEPTFNFRLSLQ